MNLSMRRGGRLGSTWAIIIIAGAAIIVGGFIISNFTGATLPVQASAEANEIDGLFTFLMFLGGVVFILVQALLVITIVRYRRRPGDDADGATFEGNATLEIIWTAIPAVIVVILALYSYSVWVSIRTPKPDELSVQTLGQRFAWTFTYEDPLGRIPEDAPQTFNDSILHTYVGRPVVLHMQTSDVNHAFWVPTMRIKQDLLAGRTTDIRFTPTMAGRYRIVCTELCGSGHGAMYSYIQVYATEQEWMERFIDQRVDRILNPPTDPVSLGFNILSSGGSQRVSSAYPCAGCHVNDALGWGGLTGPTLNGIADTAVRRAGASGTGSPEAYLASSIRHPNDYIVPGYQPNIMPQFGAEPEPVEPVDGPYYVHMPDEDLIEIVAYLCTQSSTGASTCGDIESITAAVEAQR